MPKPITIHKRVKYKGKDYCLCPSTGRKITNYYWANVNCQHCHSYRQVEFTNRQMAEILRNRKPIL